MKIDQEKFINFPPSNEANTIRYLKEYFKSIQSDIDDFLSIIEIHSDETEPRYNNIPPDLTSKINYNFFKGVTTLPDLFRIISMHSSSQHTIVYLDDEKNILSPQFGKDDKQYQGLYLFYKALHRKLNLVINAPNLKSKAFKELTETGILNLVAVGSLREQTQSSFPDLLFNELLSKSKIESGITLDLSYPLRQPGIENLIAELSRAQFKVQDKFTKAENVSISEYITKSVRSCDVHVVILGEVYGAALQNIQHSITFMDDAYMEALAAKKTCFDIHT